MALCGLVTLGLAIAASIAVVADFIYGEAVGLPLAGATLLFLAVLWFAVPRLYAREDDEA
jgi:hypothetical protein